jgi:hypothetical protein
MRELYAYVWRSSASQQMVLIILAIIAAVLATAPLELQRHIINTLAGHEKVENLLWLCGGYLIAALSIGGLKYLVNIKSAGLGEYMIRSLREAVPLVGIYRPRYNTRRNQKGQIRRLGYDDLQPAGGGREIRRGLHFNPE